MALTPRQKEFLLKLADLCGEYHASFAYSTADDGIHIEAEGETVFVGFLGWSVEDVSGILRAAAENGEVKC